MATTDALVALVKSGSAGCSAFGFAYRLYVDVKAGDTLVTPAGDDISHVTYCTCTRQTTDVRDAGSGEGAERFAEQIGGIAAEASRGAERHFTATLRTELNRIELTMPPEDRMTSRQ